MRANYFIGSGVLSTFLLFAVLFIGAIIFNIQRGALIVNGFIFYGQIGLIAVTGWLITWCMKAILQAVQTLETQWNHLRMLHTVKFNCPRDEELESQLGIVTDLIKENDRPPKVFDTIPLNRAFASVMGTLFASSLGTALYLFLGVPQATDV